MRTKRSFNSCYFTKLPGFSLIEMALVTLFMGLLFTMLVSMHIQVDQLGKRASVTSDIKKNLYRTVEHIADTLNHTYYIKGEKNLLFRGEKDGNEDARRDRVSFAYIDPYVNALNRESDAKEVTYYLRETQNSDVFDLIKREDAIVDNEPEVGGVHMRLLSGVESFRVGYAKRKRGDVWEDKWDSRNKKRIPKRIKFEIRVRTGAEQTISIEGVARPGLLTSYK